MRRLLLSVEGEPRLTRELPWAAQEGLDWLVDVTRSDHTTLALHLLRSSIARMYKQILEGVNVQIRACGMDAITLGDDETYA